MDLLLIAIGALFVLVLLSHACSVFLDIHDDAFFSHFHFVAGFLTTVLFFLLFKNYFLALALTVGVGVLWEFYEWLLWKYVMKKEVFKPQPKDTMEDIILDFVGGLLALVILVLIASRG